MDPTPYLAPKPAPCIVFDALPSRSERVRFHVPDGDGWRDVKPNAFSILASFHFRHGQPPARRAPGVNAILGLAAGSPRT